MPGFKLGPPPTYGPGIVPLFLEGGGFSSSLVMVNPALKNVSGTISLRDLEGRPTVTKEIVLESGNRRSISISSLLQGFPDAPAMGSLSILQDVTVPGKVIMAQLTIVDRRNSTPPYIDEEITMGRLTARPRFAGSPILPTVRRSSQSSISLILPSA